jgi:hypothetical protein
VDDLTIDNMDNLHVKRISNKLIICHPYIRVDSKKIVVFELLTCASAMFECVSPGAPVRRAD